MIWLNFHINLVRPTAVPIGTCDVIRNSTGNFCWSSTEFANDPLFIIDFKFLAGIQTAGTRYQIPDTKDESAATWAVQDSDVGAAAVPEPGTISPMGLGSKFARRRASSAETLMLLE